VLGAGRNICGRDDPVKLRSPRPREASLQVPESACPAALAGPEQRCCERVRAHRPDPLDIGPMFWSCGDQPLDAPKPIDERTCRDF
jgi:hypothetical protein